MVIALKTLKYKSDRLIGQGLYRNSSNSGNLVKSLEIIMPDPVSGTGQARFGIRNVLNLLDSGFRRNDGKENFSTFYEIVRIAGN